MSRKHTVLAYSMYTVRHAATLKWLPIEWLSHEWETYGTDLQHVHGATCRNTEIASHKNGYRMSGKHTVLAYSTYTVRHAVTLKWLPIRMVIV